MKKLIIFIIVVTIGLCLSACKQRDKRIDTANSNENSILNNENNEASVNMPIDVQESSVTVGGEKDNSSLLKSDDEIISANSIDTDNNEENKSIENTSDKNLKTPENTDNSAIEPDKTVEPTDSDYTSYDDTKGWTTGWK